MKKKVGTLLAVTLAAAPAVAGPMHAKHEEKQQVVEAEPDPWAGTKTVTAFPPNMPDSVRRLQAQLIVDGAFAVFGVTTPRVLRSGAPACGNVQTKGPPPPCTEDE